MKKTVLNNIHEALGAKMVPFAGYLMPVQYQGVNHEHLTVRSNAGIFDVSHMGEFMISGERAMEFLQWVTSNDVSTLVDGKVQYTCFPNSTGGIIDDLLLYRFSETEYMLVVNASNIEKDWNWLVAQNTFGVKLENKSDDWGLLAVQGPKAIEILQKLTSVDLSSVKYYNFRKDNFAGFDNIIISATGYTGSGGFEIYSPNANLESIWKKIMEAGKDFGLEPAGLAARDTLRLEMGFCLYGNDIDDKTSPLEAGLGWITKLKTDFVAADILRNQKNVGVSKKLVGLELVEKGIPRKGYPLCAENGDQIGEITSGTMSPSLKKGIGMGYVKIDFAEPGTNVFVEIRQNKIPAKIVKLPFLTL